MFSITALTRYWHCMCTQNLPPLLTNQNLFESKFNLWANWLHCQSVHASLKLSQMLALMPPAQQPWGRQHLDCSTDTYSVTSNKTRGKPGVAKEGTPDQPRTYVQLKTVSDSYSGICDNLASPADQDLHPPIGCKFKFKNCTLTDITDCHQFASNLRRADTAILRSAYNPD